MKKVQVWDHAACTRVVRLTPCIDTRDTNFVSNPKITLVALAVAEIVTFFFSSADFTILNPPRGSASNGSFGDCKYEGVVPAHRLRSSASQNMFALR